MGPRSERPEVGLTRERPKCILLLSSKSSGSSALQNLLSEHPKVRVVGRTRHNENETLYWVKAASVLGMPQVGMADSEVPIPRGKARSELVRFLGWNLGPGYRPPGDDRELIFGGWRALCDRYAPVFLEKSPHHLHQRSAVELILECMERCDDVDFLLVGLVRNPMDALYSMWRRRREIPEVHQHEWREAYENLRLLEQRVPDRVLVVRYEDVIDDPTAVGPVCSFAGIDIPRSDYLHGGSLGRWRRDARYGFRLDDDVLSLARSYGYSEAELSNEARGPWPLYRRLIRWPYRAVRPAKLLVREARKRARMR